MEVGEEGDYNYTYRYAVTCEPVWPSGKAHFTLSPWTCIYIYIYRSMLSPCEGEPVWPSGKALGW